MKRYTESKFIKESWNDNLGTGNNLGNSPLTKGVMNHYTPIENIISNVTNLFGARLSIVANVAEDNVSLKLYSSKFSSIPAIEELLYMHLYNDICGGDLYSYIVSQGLTVCKIMQIGKDFVVYFMPADMPHAVDNKDITKSFECKEMMEANVDEVEINSLIKEDDEEELKDATVEKVLELVKGDDKVKAAKQLEILVSNEISLPREYYFAAVKFKSGEEAIALRWKYTKEMPKKVTVENVRSIMHIFGEGEDGIWVQDFAKDSMVQLPDEVKKLIESVLDLLNAKETDNPAIFRLDNERKERKEKDKDEDDEDKKDDEKDDKDKKDKKKDDLLGGDDDEDDESRGDESDDLL